MTTNLYYGVTFQRDAEQEDTPLSPIEGLDQLSCIFHGTNDIAQLRSLNSFVFRSLNDLDILEGISHVGLSHSLTNEQNQPQIGVDFVSSVPVGNSRNSPVDITLSFNLLPTESDHFLTWHRQSDGVFETTIGDVKGLLKFGWDNELPTAELSYKWHNAPEHTRRFKQVGEVIALTRNH